MNHLFAYLRQITAHYELIIMEFTGFVHWKVVKLYDILNKKYIFIDKNERKTRKSVTLFRVLCQ